MCVCVRRLTGTLGHADGAVLVLGIGVGLQFEGVLVVDERLGTQRDTRARVVELPARLQHTVMTQSLHRLLLTRCPALECPA